MLSGNVQNGDNEGDQQQATSKSNKRRGRKHTRISDTVPGAEKSTERCRVADKLPEDKDQDTVVVAGCRRWQLFISQLITGYHWNTRSTQSHPVVHSEPHVAQ
jgi:hypothetical protein